MRHISRGKSFKDFQGNNHLKVKVELFYFLRVPTPKIEFKQVTAVWNVVYIEL